MTNIHLKDGQEPPKQISYKVGRLYTWEFSNFVDSGMESIYKRRKPFTKTHIKFSDGSDNYILSVISKRNGKKFLKKDHWVNVYGHTVMPIIWKPSGKVKFAIYNSEDKTLYEYAKKNYPQGTWMREVPKWVREK